MTFQFKECRQVHYPKQKLIRLFFFLLVASQIIIRLVVIYARVLIQTSFLSGLVMF
jgi:hypothetical protein